jgi:1-acyl-sn-glycerol-3-phosphate acyltransferase
VIRSIWVSIVAVSVLATVGTVCIVGSYVGLPRGFYQWSGRLLSRAMLWAAGTPVSVIGLENIDRERPQVITCNHQSMYDIWALAALLPVRYHFVAKKEIRKIPIFGRASQAAGHVFVDRGHLVSAIESLKVAGRRIVEESSSAVVFPEGTRSVRDSAEARLSPAPAADHRQVRPACGHAALHAREPRRADRARARADGRDAGGTASARGLHGPAQAGATGSRLNKVRRLCQR